MNITEKQESYSKSYADKIQNRLDEMRELGILEGHNGTLKFRDGLADGLRNMFLEHTDHPSLSCIGEPIVSKDFIELFLNELNDEDRQLCIDCMNDEITKDEIIEQKYREIMLNGMMLAIAKTYYQNSTVYGLGKTLGVYSSHSTLNEFLKDMDEETREKFSDFIMVLSWIKQFQYVLFLEDGR